MPNNHLKQHLLFLDGLRTVAIVAVLIYHADIAWMPGGFLGVEVFFVISGFIITKLLHDEWLSSGKIAFGHFWRHRFRRLLPAVATMMLTTWLVVLWLFPDVLPQILEDMPYGISFTSNWASILAERSYFAAMGRPRLFEHLWSLAVEFQFYMLWPLCCLALFRWRAWLSAVVVLGGALLSTWWMAHLYQPEADPTRVYFGTDTRAAALLMGGLVALSVTPTQAVLSERVRRMLNRLNILIAAVLLLLLFLLKSTQTFLYQGGFLVVSTLTALLISICLFTYHQTVTGTVSAILSSKPMVALGIRAYGIYLWHWPVYCLTQPLVDVPVEGFELFGLRLLLTAMLSELCHRYIELPVMHGYFEKLYQNFMTSSAMQRKKILVRNVLAACCLLAAMSGLAIATDNALVSQQTVTDQGEDAANQPVAEPGANLNAGGEIPPGAAAAATSDAAGPPAGQDNNAAACLCSGQAEWHDENRLKTVKNEKGWITRVQTADTATTKSPVFAVGDSVMVGATAELLKRLPCLSIDAQVGRQLASGIQILGDRKRDGLLGDTVIIHLGNNGPIDDNQIDSLLTLLSDRKNVFFITLKLPRNYEGANNAILRQAALKNPNVHIINWRSKSLSGDNVFGKDGIHLTGNGAKMYAELVVAAVAGEVD